MFLYGRDGASGLLKVTADGAVLNLFAENGKSLAHIGVGTNDLRPSAQTGAEGSLVLFSGISGPSLEIKDRDGFSVVAGKVGLRTEKTGETKHTSAASLRLFGNDGSVLWAAP